MPHKHYKTEVIEAVVSGHEEKRRLDRVGCQADDSTMWRWIRQFKERGVRAVGWMLSILLKVYERYVSALELYNKGLLKQLSRLLQEIPAHGTAGTFGMVNIILTRYNSGFL